MCRELGRGRLSRRLGSFERLPRRPGVRTRGHRGPLAGLSSIPATSRRAGESSTRSSRPRTCCSIAARRARSSSAPSPPRARCPPRPRRWARERSREERPRRAARSRRGPAVALLRQDRPRRRGASRRSGARGGRHRWPGLSRSGARASSWPSSAFPTTSRRAGVEARKRAAEILGCEVRLPCSSRTGCYRVEDLKTHQLVSIVDGLVKELALGGDVRPLRTREPARRTTSWPTTPAWRVSGSDISTSSAIPRRAATP